jgi:RimJ/RimL family protein N-acetyltransferase
MRHSLQVEGFGIRLRPVRMEDAAFIVWLRNLDHVKGKIGDSAVDVASQEAWLQVYFDREGDYYFIAETLAGIPLGTHGIYDIKGNSAEKGRQVVRPEVVAGVPTAILATDVAFGILGLTELRSTTSVANVTVRSLHRKSGYKQVGIRRNALTIAGRPVDLVDYLITPEDWFRVRDSLLPLAHLAGAQALEWGKTQLGKSQPWERQLFERLLLKAEK